MLRAQIPLKANRKTGFKGRAQGWINGSHEFRTLWRINENENMSETIWRRLKTRVIGYKDMAKRAGNQKDEGFHRIKYLRRPKIYSESATQSLTNTGETIKY